MSTTIDVELPNVLLKYAERQVAAGRYASVEAMVCALLQRKREEDAKEKFLAIALHEAMESKPGVPAEEVFADLERAFPWLRDT